jgi:hypothetical protein
VIVSPQKSSNTLEAPVRAPSGPHRKPKADLYTVLLAIALLAVLVAILFFWLEMRSYENKSTGAPAVPLVSTQGSERQGDRETRRLGDRHRGSFVVSRSPYFLVSLSPRVLIPDS